MNARSSKRSNIHADTHSSQVPGRRRQVPLLLGLWALVLVTALWSLDGLSQDLQAQEQTATTTPVETLTLPPTSTLVSTLPATLTATPSTTSLLEIATLAPSSATVSET